MPARSSRPTKKAAVKTAAPKATAVVRDSVDDHVARWAPAYETLDPIVEGVTTRMISILRLINRGKAARYADREDTVEDLHTLHALLTGTFPYEATPAQLAETCRVTRAAMTSRIDRLVDRGLVTREPDLTDRRRIIVRPTTAGRTLWEEDLEHGTAAESAAFAPLTRRELTDLNDQLRRVLAHLEQPASD